MTKSERSVNDIFITHQNITLLIQLESIYALLLILIFIDSYIKEFMCLLIFCEFEIFCNIIKIKWFIMQ